MQMNIWDAYEKNNYYDFSYVCIVTLYTKLWKIKVIHGHNNIFFKIKKENLIHVNLDEKSEKKIIPNGMSISAFQEIKIDTIPGKSYHRGFSISSL